MASLMVIKGRPRKDIQKGDGIACVLAEEAHKRLYNPQRMSVNGSLPIKVYNNILSDRGVLSSELHSVCLWNHL